MPVEAIEEQNKFMGKQQLSDEEKKYQEMVEEIAKNIAQLSRGVHVLLNGRLTERAVVVLLASSTRLNKEVVSNVLDAISGLEKKWLK